jgi:hypothetical protein
VIVVDAAQQRPDFPSMADHERWPGAWKWGVDFSGDSRRVVAVSNGGAEAKYSTAWLGPIEITEETAGQLEAWAEQMLDVYGGYIHLFPADGDAREELQHFLVDLQGDEMEDAWPIVRTSN